MIDQNTYNRQLIEEFRADRDKGGGAMKGRPLLLLTTTGAKSGQLRTKPMMFIPDGDRLLVIASNAGAALRRNPSARGTDRAGGTSPARRVCTARDCRAP